MEVKAVKAGCWYDEAPTGGTKGPVAVIGGPWIDDDACTLGTGVGWFSASKCRDRLDADLPDGFTSNRRLRGIADEAEALTPD
jgi:hypothetical protein